MTAFGLNGLVVYGCGPARVLYDLFVLDCWFIAGLLLRGPRVWCYQYTAHMPKCHVWCYQSCRVYVSYIINTLLTCSNAMCGAINHAVCTHHILSIQCSHAQMLALGAIHGVVLRDDDVDYM